MSRRANHDQEFESSTTHAPTLAQGAFATGNIPAGTI